MARNSKVGLPSSGAGIVRYFDEYQSRLQFKPGVVILLVILVMIIEVILYLYGNAVFGVA